MRDERQHWAHVKQVLNLALDASPEERSRVVKEACDGSAELESDVISLLEYSGQTGELDRCLHETAAGLILSAEAPTRIGPYRIERMLGSGGMGTVYLGVRDDDELPARVALKVIRAESCGELRERFRSERRILSNLIHPYIVRLLDAGQLDDGRPYFVMEYVDGQTIDEYALSHQPTVLDLFLKVCSAVQFAHQNLVIHRDLKPSNILVTPSGEPRLLDFGIAKLLAGLDSAPAAASLDRTQPREQMLTPVSASPEQAAGEPITMASDVYSLGVLLYRLLTGLSPYAAAKEFTTDPMRVIREYEPPLASTAGNLAGKVRAALEGDLDDILRKALEKDPARRYPTVHELAADIGRHLKGLPVEACPASFSYRTSKFIRRNRLAVTASVMLGLAIVGGLVGTTLYAHRAHVEQVRAQRELGALRKLTQSFLFEFDDAIKNLPGSSAARELVVRRTVEYLDQLASEAGDDTVQLNDLADAYTHVARIAGGFNEAHADNSPGTALPNLVKALAIRRRLFALNPGDEKARLSLRDSLWRTAAKYASLGDFQRARELHQEHLRMCQQAVQRTSSVEWRYNLGTAFTSNGEVERNFGHYDLALDYQRRGLAVREGLLKDDPSSARAKRVVGISHQFVGYALASQQNYAAASDEHRKALALFEPIARADRRNVELERLTADAQESLCESMSRAGAPEAAISHCEAAIALYSGMAAADPTDVQSSADLASSESAMSIALDLAHSPQAALEHQEKARRIFVAGMSRDPEAFDLAKFNAESLMELATLRQQLHIATAADAAAEAVRDLKDLAARSPQNHEIAATLQRAEDLYKSMR